MKPLLPSLKEKKRYIVYKIISENNIDTKLAQTEIKNQCLKFLGELGYSKAGIQTIDQNIIKVNTKYLNETKMALGLIKKINDKKAIVDVTGVSGIIKKAKSKFGGR
ncbi:MAG: Rpp14/Pop5 family protein [Candidatus Woesearchaeota archaeon]